MTKISNAWLLHINKRIYREGFENATALEAGATQFLRQGVEFGGNDGKNTYTLHGERIVNIDAKSKGGSKCMTYNVSLPLGIAFEDVESMNERLISSRIIEATLKQSSLELWQPHFNMQSEAEKPILFDGGFPTLVNLLVKDGIMARPNVSPAVFNGDGSFVGFIGDVLKDLTTHIEGEAIWYLSPATTLKHGTEKAVLYVSSNIHSGIDEQFKIHAHLDSTQPFNLTVKKVVDSADSHYMIYDSIRLKQVEGIDRWQAKDATAVLLVLDIGNNLQAGIEWQHIKIEPRDINGELQACAVGDIATCVSIYDSSILPAFYNYIAST